MSDKIFSPQATTAHTPSGRPATAPAVTAATAIEPFTIEVPEDDLLDLRRRLEQTRWPDELPDSGWDYGVPLTYLRSLVDYWQSGYDWRDQEKIFNDYPQFLTTIDGQRIHFLHIRSPHEGALPLLLLHGWPGSVAEFLDVIGPLCNPTAHGGAAADAFHLVIPSLPGFGFSGPTHDKGWDVARTARAFAVLMERLGYERYGVQGGDIGALIGPELAHVDPDYLAGVHLNAATVGFIPWGEVPEADLATLTAVEKKRLEALRDFMANGNAYFTMQASRPQMIGYALTDSPVGQLTWILDRMAAWVHGPIDEALSPDQILTNVMFYWLTRTATSSARMYYENMHAQPDWGRSPSGVPVGVAVFAEDLAIRRYGEQGLNITHWSDFDDGGHFAAMERPQLLTADMRSFFNSVR
ncbi:epoxide hydrolase family protein [Rathayibacter soli]|uniref:epoxide hydrolase family protein n=1 Tax=Rathayibacter soli TaxID=3144168 RepID=UPI0027E44BF0|nr:epoxide hydrolase [Glaciibacter superstes]